MCGIFSIDSMDCVLAVCHFKKVIHTVNAVFSMCNDSLSPAKSEDNTAPMELITDLRTAMFDIRELSWQAILFCDAITE
jgi:hypothetical protein